VRNTAKKNGPEWGVTITQSSAVPPDCTSDRLVDRRSDDRTCDTRARSRGRVLSGMSVQPTTLIEYRSRRFGAGAVGHLAIHRTRTRALDTREACISVDPDRRAERHHVACPDPVDGFIADPYTAM